MIQKAEELDQFYVNGDPWEYEDNPYDKHRLDKLLASLPKKEYLHTLDIGCGNGFITEALPGKEVIGVDFSQKAVDFAIERSSNKNRVKYQQGDIFDIDILFRGKLFDLIVITGVLYPQYIGQSSSLIYQKIDQILAPGGILVSVHIDQWYRSQFPYLLVLRTYYPYKQGYQHCLEVYAKRKKL